MADGASTTMQGDLCGVEFKMPRGLNIDDLDTCWQQWQKFKDSFRIFILAAGFEKLTETRKAALLLNCIGTSALELYLNVLKTDDKPKLEEVIRLFDEYFKPKSNDIQLSTQNNISHNDHRLHNILQYNKGSILPFWYATLKMKAQRTNISFSLIKSFHQPKFQC